MALTLSPGEVKEALRELAKRLNADEVEATFYLMGGAAMCIGYLPDRRQTDDVHVKVEGFERIEPIVQAIAGERGYRPDWVNTSASKLISQMNDEADWVLWERLGAVTFYIASAPLLLAMKVAAARPNRDITDIERLLVLLNIKTWDEIQENFEHYLPGELPTLKAESLVRAILGKISQSN